MEEEGAAADTSPVHNRTSAEAVGSGVTAEEAEEAEAHNGDGNDVVRADHTPATVEVATRLRMAINVPAAAQACWSSQTMLKHGSRPRREPRAAR